MYNGIRDSICFIHLPISPSVISHHLENIIFLPDSVGLSLLSLFVASIYTGYIRYVQMLAWRIQRLQHLDGLNLSDENILNATTCQTVERIQLALKFALISIGALVFISRAWLVRFIPLT